MPGGLPSPKERSAPGATRRALAIFLGSLAIYLANARSIPSGDTVPARFLPLSIVSQGNFDLDEFPFLYRQGRPYFLQYSRGHYVSSYPVGAALLAVPCFFPLAALGVDPQSPVLIAVEKLAASVIVAASAAVLFLALARLVSLGSAVWLTIVYALGTSAFSQSSQALWQHGPAQLAIATGLYAALRAGGREPHSRRRYVSDGRWLALAGFSLAFAIVCRPGDALIVAPIVAYLATAHRERRSLFALLLAAAVPLAFQLAYNAAIFGDATRLQWPLAEVLSGSGSFATGLAGILVSPSRGLFVYSPILALSLIGAALAWRREGEPLLRWLGVSAVAYLLLNAGWEMWWGGTCYGPRLLADLSPVLVVLIAPLAARLEADRAWRVAFVLLLAWSVGMHAIGAFCTDLGWNDRRDVDRHPERLWSWTDNQPVECVRALIAGGGREREAARAVK